MTEVAAIGDPGVVGGFALAGARVYPAETAEAVLAAWSSLPESVGLVILTPAAAATVGEGTGGARTTGRRDRLTVVTPP